MGKLQQGIRVAAAFCLQQFLQGAGFGGRGRGIGQGVGGVQTVQLTARLLAAGIGGALQIQAIVFLAGLDALSHAAELRQGVQFFGTVGVFDVQGGRKRLIIHILVLKHKKHPLFCKFRVIPNNSKCRYGERGAADAKPKAQAILCVLASILATQMLCRSRRSGA